jgi:hypothetical protein
MKLIKKKQNTFCNNYKFKDKNGVLIIEMHRVGLFIVLMILQKYTWMLFKWRIVYYVILNLLFLQIKKKSYLKKGLLSYYKTSGITCLQKHLDAKHSVIYKKFQEEINIIKGKKMLINNLQRRGLVFSILPYLNFLLQKILSKRMMWNKRCLWRILHF